jgi:hypothetical protein
MNVVTRRAASATLMLIAATQVLAAQAVGAAEPSASAVAPASVMIWADVQGEPAHLLPGSYVMTEVPNLSITFTVPDGWYKGNVPFVAWENSSNSSVGFHSPDNLLIDACDPALGMRDPAVGPTAADFVAALGTMPGLTVSEPLDVTVGGYTGKLIEVTADPDAGCTGELELWDFAGIRVPGPGPGAGERLWILDVDGTRLIITARLRAEASPDVKPALDGVVESIRIGTP